MTIYPLLFSWNSVFTRYRYKLTFSLLPLYASVFQLSDNKVELPWIWRKVPRCVVVCSVRRSKLFRRDHVAKELLEVHLFISRPSLPGDTFVRNSTVLIEFFWNPPVAAAATGGIYGVVIWFPSRQFRTSHPPFRELVCNRLHLITWPLS
jgi:hypothetical protein